MSPIDIVCLVIIGVCIGLALIYIIRSKTRGGGCIGCPDAPSCSGCNKCSGCTGCSECGKCGGDEKK